MTLRTLMLACAALALLMLVALVAAASPVAHDGMLDFLVVRVYTVDMGKYRTCRLVTRTKSPVVELHGPYVRVVHLMLPSGPVIIHRWQFGHPEEMPPRPPKPAIVTK